MWYCYTTIIRDTSTQHDEKIYTVKIDDVLIGGLGAGRSIENSISGGPHTISFIVDGEERQSVEFNVAKDKRTATIRVRYNPRTANIDVSFVWNPTYAAASGADAFGRKAPVVKDSAAAGVFSLIFGIAALCLSRFSAIAAVLAIPAVICGLVGIVKKKKHFALGIVGLILGILACYFTATVYLDAKAAGEDLNLLWFSRPAVTETAAKPQ